MPPHVKIVSAKYSSLACVCHAPRHTHPGGCFEPAHSSFSLFSLFFLFLFYYFFSFYTFKSWIFLNLIIWKLDGLQIIIFKNE
jgi:uncharacterized RDD family membrane protein YckC